MGFDWAPHPEASQIRSGPSVQEQDRLGMKSQLEGAGLGLPLQGGAWGHNPGSRQPRREDAFREEAGENTHSSIGREGSKQTPGDQSWPGARPGRLIPGDQRHVAGSSQPGGSETLPGLPHRGPAQVVPGHGRDREAGPGVPRGPQHLGSTGQIRYHERGN